MNSSWHRSEPRDVRPFFDVARAEDAVLESKIRLFEGAAPSNDALFDIEEPDLQRLKLVVLPNIVPVEQWMPSGYTADEFGLVVLATNPFLRNSTVIIEHSLAETLPAHVEIDHDTLVELGGGRNLNVTIAVHLRADRPPSPGRPFVVGHWLSRKDFAIRTPNTGRFFDVRLRTDEEWIAAGFPAKTFYHVDYHGGICEQTEGDARIATIWVHGEAHNRMSSDRLGDGIQKIIAAEIVVQILRESIEEWQEVPDSEIPARSPLAMVLKKLSPGSLITVADLKALVDGSRKDHLRPMLQDEAGLVRSLS